MANHNLPTQSSTYVNFVTELDSRFDDLCLGLDPARTTMTNLPTNSVGWSSASNNWKRWTGSAWTDLATSYAISISGNASTATTLQTARTINGVSFNGSANISVNTVNSITFDNAGTGAASGSTFNGSAALTISYNSIGAPSITGTNASGTWGISITGNAATVTNGVYTTGNQTIAGIKTFSSTISGSINGNAGTVTNGVYTTGDQTIAGIKTFSGEVRMSGTEKPLYLYFTSSTNQASIRANAGGNVVIKTGTTAPADRFTFAANTGDFTATGNVTAYSDAKLKKDLQVINDALDKVKGLTGYTYTRIDTNTRQTGLIAQDVQKVLPEAVMEGETLSLAYGNMIGLLVEAIKELEARVKVLETK